MVQILVAVGMVGLVLAVVLPSITTNCRCLSRTAACSANLRGLGQALHIYAADNDDAFPMHYFEPRYATGELPAQHGISYIGTMGSHPYLRIDQQTSPTLAPRRGHVSRSLFLLISEGVAATGQFVCPQSGDKEDDLRNHAPGGSVAAGVPGRDRFDFAGYDRLSFAYQIPYGPAGQPRLTRPAVMPLLAEKGPYYEAGGPGLAGTMTIADRRSQQRPPISSGSLQQLLAQPDAYWSPYNSRNHQGASQAVLFKDAHAARHKTPLAGINHDNIYTAENRMGPGGAPYGVVADKGDTIGPATDSDSYLLP